jgi:hypothetical protein
VIIDDDRSLRHSRSHLESWYVPGVLGDFMRVYVRRKARLSFEAEARRQSIAIAARARDPDSDEQASLRVLEVLLDEDSFLEE